MDPTMAGVDFQNSFILVLFSTLCLFVFLILFKKPKNVFDLLPPSPPSLPIIGHLHLLVSGTLHKSLQKVSSKYGPFLHLRIFNIPIVLASSASVVSEIFREHDINVSSHGTVGIDDCLVFGSNSFIKAPYGDYWKFMKKVIVAKMLGPLALERLRGVREVELDRFYRHLLGKAMKKQTVEIGEELLRFDNTILGKLSFGSTFSDEDEAQVSKFTVEIAALTRKVFIQQILRKPFEKLGILPFRKELMDVSNRFDKLLEKLLVQYEKTSDENPLTDTTFLTYRDQAAEYKVTRKHIKALAAELFFGAGDTTSTATRWVMAEIFNHPKIHERLREEIDTVVGRTRLIQETDLPKLPYLQAVIKESLRLHPPGVVLPREFIQGCKIREFYIPQGTTLFINAYAVMRDPDSWEDPDEFKPERFLGQAEEKKEKLLKYLAFGAGRRGCPGTNLGYILLGIAVGMMVQCFHWEIEGDKVNMEEASGRAFLTMAHPLKCTPVPRILNL